jgi:N-acetyl-anhydromuramyl-L-alanine amidase AmpD
LPLPQGSGKQAHVNLLPPKRVFKNKFSSKALSSRTLRVFACSIGAAFFALTGCQSPKFGTESARTGDEIVVAGRFIHTGTPVVLWLDPGGYDAYRVERRFSAIDRADWAHSQEDVPLLRSPNRFSLRRPGLSSDEIERVRGGGWDLPLLQRVVDQFVLHFDVCGVSRECFRTLQDQRDLSVHFMLDLDGTIYQTLDLKERAWHATSSNDRSVGIEIANMGDFKPGRGEHLSEWYTNDPPGHTRITIPQKLGDGGIRTRGFVGHPSRPEPVEGIVQGETLAQYDFTPEQYKALVKLAATLCTVFPKIKCDYPRDNSGKLITSTLPEDALKEYEGILGHYHVQTDKTDPGPAFQWDYLISGARALLAERTNNFALPDTGLGHMRRRD